MEKFLHTVAQRIWSEHQHDIDKVMVVFNNRRAGLFLKKEMRTLGDKPFFLPQIVGIDDLISTLGKQQIIQHEFLLFELYDIHRSLEGVGRRFDTFEEFISFGEMMLSDFSEIDLYCVDAKHLFSHIYEHRRLGEWDVSGHGLTPFQEKYLNFYHSLYTYYTRLRKQLSDNNKAYTGMAYRYVAENIESLIGNIDCSHIYFVGFNALSTSESRIIKFCINSGMATLLCDGDKYYFDNKSQEAGKFLNNNKQIIANKDSFIDHFALEKKKIHIINCPENVLQAKATGQVIEHLMSNPDNEAPDTAIVLADENLLLPVLNSLPNQVKTTNVTMGFPFTFTNVNNLATKLLSLYSNNRDGRFYHVDITNVLSDTIISRYLGTKNLYSHITSTINKNKIIRATKDDISLILNGIERRDDIMFLFDNPMPNVAEVMGTMRRLFTLINESDIFDKNTKEKEALACFIQILNYLDDLQEKKHFIERIETLQKIYLRLAQRRSVPFYGEPLEGLQILGMLETRSLDFRNVILLSLNEGSLPAAKNTNSLIPLSLKIQYGIPAFSEKDAVYAYNFYRLLQRASNIWLLYSSDAEGIGKGEPSRFILQIKNELAPHYSNIEVSEEVVAAQNSTANAINSQSIQKDKRTLLRLKAMATDGFSPSALNRYRGCPLQFFYGDVLGVKETEEVSEELESNELGTFIHELLKDIYLRDDDHIVKIDTLQQALNETSQLVDDNFKDKALKGRNSEGKNHIYNEVAKMQITHFLQKEIDSLKAGRRIEISLVEEQMKMPIALDADADTKPYIKGIADRIDIVDGQMRIADYKSGRVKAEELSVNDAEPDPHNVPDKWFQVMCYAWLYCRKHNYKGPFTAGIFPLSALSSDFMPASWEQNKVLDTSHIDQFENLLKKLLDEIMEPSTPFHARPDKDRCSYCPFDRICSKQQQST